MYKHIVELLVAKKITEKNFDQIELEMANNICMFLQRFFKMTKWIKLKACMQMRRDDTEKIGPKFDLVVSHSMTLIDLENVICEVCLMSVTDLDYFFF